MPCYSYSLRKALPPRKRFAIQRTYYENGKKFQGDFKDEILKSVNESLLSGLIDYNLALQKLEKHLENLKGNQKPDYIVDDATKKIMTKVLVQQSKELNRGKIRHTTYAKLETEIALLQELLKGEDVLTAETETLHDLYSSKGLAVSTINKLIILTNRLRKLAGVTTKVSHLTDKSILGGRVEYLKKDEIEVLLDSADAIDFHIIKFAIASGLREGELFGIDKKTYKNGYLDITRQMYRDGSYGNPKNNRRRTVPLSSSGKESYDYLIENYKHFKDQRTTFSNRLRRLTKRYLGHHYSVYDLRHTYAINCLQINIGPLKICGWMGNSVAVLQAHYIGFMVDATQDDVQKLNAV